MTLKSLSKAVVLSALSAAPSALFADGICGRSYAEYQLQWTSNAMNETNLAGAPTLGHAFSKLGPPLPVAFHYGGQTERFAFDSPKVGDVGMGVMELKQHLATHSETTVTELWFDRNVHNLSIEVHDFDEDVSFPKGYADRLIVTGSSKSSSDDHIHPVVTEYGKTPRQQTMRRVVKRANNLAEADIIRPIPGQRHSRTAFTAVTAHFQDPVQKVSISFGSDPTIFSVRRHSPTPQPQRLILGDVKFCVALDNS